MSSPVSTQTPVLVDESKGLRRYVLLFIFCLAQFLDALNSSALLSALPRLVIALHMSQSESTWLISAYQLTFASFLLISGRISDVYNPKTAFIGGFAVLGFICLGTGFTNDKIAAIVCRALMGVAASLTIPSALTLLVNLFPKPSEQAWAVGLFGGCGAIGNVLGEVIGAIFTQYASWRWNFWFVASIAIPVALSCIWIIPATVNDPENSDPPKTGKWRTLDLTGVSILTAALILFIFSVTSGSTDGWSSAAVIAPLIISLGMTALFFFYETKIPSTLAAIPPQTWFFPNFAVLFGAALLPIFWWTGIFMLYTVLWQDVYHWSVISTGVRMVPIGVAAFIASFSGRLSRVINPKWLILFGECMIAIATILLVFADGPGKYWSYVFPAFCIGSAGASLAFAHTNIAMFSTTPASMAGTVGAIFNCALQLGSAVGLAAVDSIVTSVENTRGSQSYDGQAAAFWFLFAIVCVEMLSMLIFYRVKKGPPTDQAHGGPEVSELDSEHAATETKGSVVVEDCGLRKAEAM